jgi:ADP-ribose pyrophosphatase
MRREIEEEAGVTARRMHEIGRFVLSPGASDETIIIYAGEVTAPAVGPGAVHGLAAENEDIRVVVVPAEQAIAQALAGELPNSVATIGLLWLAARRDFLRELWR